MQSTLFDRVFILQEKFRYFSIHKKKLRALNHYSKAAPFQHKSYLVLVKKCMDNGHLGEKESDFLSYMVQKYGINFLDWAHKTKWLKKQMNSLKEKHFPNANKKMTRSKPMFLFDPEKKSNYFAQVPFEVLAMKKPYAKERIK